MADLDVLLRESLNRIAELGDPSGVANLIRTRAAGGPGPSSSGPSSSGPAVGPTAGSSGGAASGLAGWLPWAGAALVVGIAGGAAGALGLFGSPPASPTGIGGITDGGVVAYGCPAGSPVTNLEPGQRVLATKRTDDSTWLAVRDPYDLGRTVWLPAGVVVVDPGEPEPGTLPVGGCPVPSSAPSPSPSESAAPPPPAPEPAPAPAPGPKPAPPPPPPPPPADTTQPNISAGGWSPSPVYGQTWPCGSSSSTITITATDNFGVANVSGSTTFPGASVSLQSHSGSSWVFVFQMPNANPPSGSAAVSFTAVDGAGNSRSVSAPLAVSYCLI